jgi:hypothetical protein
LTIFSAASSGSSICFFLESTSSYALFADIRIGSKNSFTCACFALIDLPNSAAALNCASF